ncbi:MAG: hypothetical protein Q7L19_02060 [Pseudohongiella sp.]|nr:hypothetical protein [Pseudohongiella sp.]
MYEKSDSNRSKATPELTAYIREIVEPENATLSRVRELLMDNDLMMSDGGEVLFKLDRQWLVNELDELIIQHGGETLAKEIVAD